MVQLVIMALFGVGLVQISPLGPPRKPDKHIVSGSNTRSSRFVEAEYIDSGIGVPGVDKRLVLPGNYAEAMTLSGSLNIFQS